MEKEKYLQIIVTFVLGISLSIQKIKKITVYLLKLPEKTQENVWRRKKYLQINVTFVLGISLSIEHHNFFNYIMQSRYSQRTHTHTHPYEQQLKKYICFFRVKNTYVDGRIGPSFSFVKLLGQTNQSASHIKKTEKKPICWTKLLVAQPQ